MNRQTVQNVAIVLGIGGMVVFAVGVVVMIFVPAGSPLRFISLAGLVSSVVGGLVRVIADA